MKRLFWIPLLFLCSIVYAAPDSSLSVTPSASSGATITAADENSRNNTITSWANNHDHTDISQTANTLKVGGGTAGNKTIQANNADANKPTIYFDDTANRWLLTQEGTDARTIVVMTGAVGGQYVIPQTGSDEDFMLYDSAGQGSLKFSKTVDIDGGTIDGVTIGGSAAPTVTNLGTVTTADINGGTLDNVTIGASTAAPATVSTLKVGTTNQGDILYDNGTTFVRLTPGTSGQVLKTNGAAANPTWVSNVVAETPVTFTTVGTTDDITVTANERYGIFIVINAASADLTLYLRFNSDSTGDDYAWNIEETAFSATPTEALTGDNADTEIDLGSIDTTGVRFWINLIFDNTALQTNIVFISGTGGGLNSAGTAVARNYHAIYSGGAPTSFELVTSTGTVSGTVTYYRFD